MQWNVCHHNHIFIIYEYTQPAKHTFASTCKEVTRNSYFNLCLELLRLPLREEVDFVFFCHGDVYNVTVVNGNTFRGCSKNRKSHDKTS